MKLSPLVILALLLNLVALALKVEAQSAVAALHPNHARGNDSSKSFDRTQWDNINLFNGNLNLSIPLGQWVSLREGFGYQLTLSYNSNIWDYKQSSATVISAWLNKKSNAGVGWDLSLGRLIDPFSSNNGLGRWVYVSPDGGLHSFYENLHNDVIEPEDNVFYTRDGSYYRLQQLNQTTAIIESPDGTVRTFEFVNGDWRLIKIADRFTNYLNISYTTANAWTLTDNHGRTQAIYFKADPTGAFPFIVDRVVLSAFGGATATYTFTYAIGTVTRSDVDNDPATSTTADLSLLTSITAPDGSKYSFTYHPAGAAADSSGRLASMQLPTLGKLGWTYQKYNFTSPSCGSALPTIYRTTAGVATRQITDMGGNPNGSWSFTTAIKTFSDPARCAEEGEMTNTVMTPVGDKTVYYFSVNTLGSNNTQWDRADYALPFTKNVADGPLPMRMNVAQTTNGATATSSSIYNTNFPASSAINGDRKALNWGAGGGWNDGTPSMPGAGEIVWVEDNLPAGVVAEGHGESWSWLSSNPWPFSGSVGHQSNVVAGLHQHYFYGATGANRLAVNQGDKLIAYVYLDPANPPSQVMLQWADSTWEHRAYWGADQLPWGTNGTNSRRYMGPLPPAGKWVRLEVPASAVGLENQQLTGMAFSLYNGRAIWDRAGSWSGDEVWVEDSVPAGGVAGGSWNWIGSNPALPPSASNPSAFSGNFAHQSDLVAGGAHQHYFYNATQTLSVGAEDLLVAYVYLDPASPPSEVMLQWFEAGSWEHRAYWGANQISWGVDGTNSRRYMGPLPAAGQWIRLSVPAAQLGLEGKVLSGMAFTLFGGRATWDRAGKTSTPGSGYPDWIQVNFNGSKTINEINVFTLQDNYSNPSEPTLDMTFTMFGLTNFEVQYWNGAAWASVGSKTANNKVWSQFLFSPVTTDKIRVYITGNLSSFSRIAEIEAITSPTANTTRFLSKQILDCDGNGNNCQLLQSLYTRYEQDGLTDPAYADITSVNRREASQRVLYHDDVEGSVTRFAGVERSDFDGLGHFRREVTNGNFGSGDVKEQTTDYDASTGTYPSVGFVMPPTTQAWLPNIYRKIKKVEGDSSQVTEVCYDRNTGFAQRQRIWWSADPAGTVTVRDVLVVYSANSGGQVVKEQYFGGDVQPLGTSSLCSLSLPGSDQYQIQYNYQYGTLSSSQFFTAAGTAFGTKFVDRDIDQNTGLVRTSRDSAGIATQFEYDQLGRTVWIKPASGQGAWTQFYRTLADGTNYAKTFIYKKTNGTANLLTYKADVQDSFGRIWWEQICIPDGSCPSRYTFRNAMGWRTHTTEYSNGGPQYTIYSGHDPFGRPRLITPPDGPAHNTTLQYAGFRAVTTMVPVATSYNQTSGQIYETPGTTIKVYDRQGRLWKTTNRTNDAFGIPHDVVTAYSYNVTSQLLETKKDGVRVGSLRTYDGRGFLASEFIQDGKYETTTYLDIDPRGNSRRTQRQNHYNGVVVFLSYDYDRAARLIKVRDPNDSTKVWKEFTYADTNDVNDWRAGKLWKTKRINDMSQFLSFAGVTIATVTETYTYGGVGGAVSKYEVEFNDSLGRHEKFNQSYSYTELGDVSEIGYPNSVIGVTIGRDRKVTYGYLQGFLRTISGSYNSQPENWATSIDYHPTGLLKQLVHANGVTDNITQDPNGFARPATVFTSGAKYPGSWVPYDFNSGAFYYDGSGSIAKVGSEFFVAQQGSQPPSPPSPPPSASPCDTGWMDPLGAVFARGDFQCNVRIFYYYTAGDRLYKVEDGVQGEKNWYFYDLSGQPLTIYSTHHAHYQAWPSLWHYTRDYIYRGRQRFVVDEKRRDAPGSTLHYHYGFGSSGIVTDMSGGRLEH